MQSAVLTADTISGAAGLHLTPTSPDGRIDILRQLIRRADATLTLCEEANLARAQFAPVAVIDDARKVFEMAANILVMFEVTWSPVLPVLALDRPRCRLNKAVEEIFRVQKVAQEQIVTLRATKAREMSRHNGSLRTATS